MAEIEVNRLSLVEVAKRTNNGNVLTVSEVLSKSNEVLQDIQWVQANQLNAHVHTRRLSLPSGTWRKANDGAAIEASATKQVVENVGLLESWSQIDETIVDSVLGDKAKFRSTEDMAFVMGLGLTFVETLITGDTNATPEKFDGLNVRMASTGTMVKSNGGTGSDLTSLYIIQWGEDMVHGIYLPDVTRPGTDTSPVKINDRGLQTVIGDNAGLFDAYRTKFVFTVGLASHDDRSMARMANIEDDASGANIIEPDLFVQVLNEMLFRGKGAMAYCHQIVLTQLDILAMDKGNAMYNIGNLWGEQVTRFRQTPLRQLESIGIAQSAVS